MTFVFTLKGLPGDADIIIPALCNGPDHAKTRARDLLDSRPGRRSVEVAHRGKLIYRYERQASIEL